MPQSQSGSFFLAAVAHASLYGLIMGMIAVGAFQSKPDPTPVNDEIAYETLSEPPTPTEVVKPLKSQPDPETPPEKTEDAEEKPHEMQDNTSTVAGTQTAAPKVAQAPGATGAGDAEATPFYKIKPKYPRAALTEGVEGWVMLKIDVNEGGEVENVRVVGGEQKNMFQDEARRAVAKWKYKPFLDASGKPIRKVDHQVRVDFKLKDAA
jgi:protein TonB